MVNDPNKMYEINVFDGDKNTLHIELTRSSLCKIISDSIAQGVKASMKIEGENVDDINININPDIPECLLQTPPPFPPFCF